MAGRRRSAASKRTLTKIDRDVNRQVLLNRISGLMRLRKLGMSPFPFAPRKFYDLVWGEDRLRAMSLLPTSVLRHSESFTVHYAKYMEQPRPYSYIMLRMGTQVPVTGEPLLDDRLSLEDAHTLYEWVRLRISLTRDCGLVERATRALLETAVTYGQLRAFWPTLEFFMPAEVRSKMCMHKKSKPSDAMHTAWAQSIPGISIANVDDMLGEAVMFDTAEFDDPVMSLSA